MLNIHLFNRYVVISLRMSRIAKIFLAAILVAGLIVAGLSVASAFSRINDKISIVQPSGRRPLTTTGDTSQQLLRPGHDFGAIYGSSDLGSSLRVDPPLLAYQVNGQMLVRRSELGPLTGTIDASIAPHRPGHDFGAIYGTIDPGLSLSISKPDFRSQYNKRR
jgi:hypothetical protein